VGKHISLYLHENRESIEQRRFIAADQGKREMIALGLPARGGVRVEAAPVNNFVVVYTTIKSVFCSGSIGPFVPVLEPGFVFWDKSLEVFVSGGKTGTKYPTR